MKNIFIILLVMLALGCSAQNNVMQYSNETTPDNNDYLYLIKDGTSDRNTSKLQFQQNLLDSITDLRADIGGTTYTAGSGMGLSGNAFTFGGVLLQTTFLSNNGIYDFDFESYDVARAASVKMLFDEGRLFVTSWEDDSYSSSNSAGINWNRASVSMGFNGVISSRDFTVDVNGFVVDDVLGARGIVYGGDYSSNSTDSSLIAKSEIEALILAGPGGVGSDTIQIGEIAPLKEDTTNLIDFAFTDSSQFVITRKYMLKRHTGPDTLRFLEFAVQVPTGTPNFAYNMYHAADGSTAGASMFSVAPVVTGSDATSTGEIDSPNQNQDVPPDHWIWIQFSDLTAKPPTGAAFSGKGYEY